MEVEADMALQEVDFSIQAGDSSSPYHRLNESSREIVILKVLLLPLAQPRGLLVE